MKIAPILQVLGAVFGSVQLRRTSRMFRLSAGNHEWLGTSMPNVLTRALIEAQGVTCTKQ
jgi:hypothetical protein